MINKILAILCLMVACIFSVAAETVRYQHTDILGSVVAESDELGNIISNSRSHYEPFGKRIGGDKEGISYTGHLQDKDLGLTYMQARYYDPLIGRFYSNDPIGFRNVHSFNRYAYANNNPYKNVDPDGKWAIPLIVGLEELGKAALVTAGVIGTGAGIEQTINAISENSATPNPESGKEPDPADKNGELTKAGRAIQKHGSRPGSAFPPATGNAESKNKQGQGVLEDIVNNPDSTTNEGNRFGGTDVIAPDGTGARFDSEGKFRGFLEPKREE